MNRFRWINVSFDDLCKGKVNTKIPLSEAKNPLPYLYERGYTIIENLIIERV